MFEPLNKPRTKLSNDPKCICAWLPDDDHGWICNVSRHPVTINSCTWPSVEHFYQAQKFIGHPDLMEQIAHEPNPEKAKGIAHAPENTPLVRSDWEIEKDEVMHIGLRAKVQQNPDVLQHLLASGDLHIVEDSPVDYYWGCGENGTGLNRLGALWEEIRQQLRMSGNKALDLID